MRELKRPAEYSRSLQTLHSRFATRGTRARWRGPQRGCSMTDLRKLTMFTVAALMLSPASGLAQVAGNSAATGPAAPSGDAAVSPASGNAQAGGARVSDRPGAGAGV